MWVRAHGLDRIPLRRSLFSLTRRLAPAPVDPAAHGSGAEITESLGLQSSHTMLDSYLHLELCNYT